MPPIRKNYSSAELKKIFRSELRANVVPGAFGRPASQNYRVVSAEKQRLAVLPPEEYIREIEEILERIPEKLKKDKKYASAISYLDQFKRAPTRSPYNETPRKIKFHQLKYKALLFDSIYHLVYEKKA